MDKLTVDGVIKLRCIRLQQRK